MFTGLVQYTSTYVLINNKLSFKNDDFWSDCSLGDSICVNGVCLTISQITEETISFDLLEETLKVTNLNKSKNIANLEKSMVFGKSLIGGHYVSGHVMETGIIRSIHSNKYCIECNSKLLTYKGSITVNGISLTVNEITDNSFSFEVIPHTFKNTNLQYLEVGDYVNIEYVTHFNYYMNVALTESLKGKYTTSPNPCVGCVIVNSDGIIVSKGYHAKYGDIHAEEMAIQALQGSFSHLTMYVTLEPCSHWGKQPPCCNAIVDCGMITKVVIGIVDPDPRVCGSGIKFLNDHGIQTEVNVLADSIKESLKAYIHYKKTNRPYVISKIALSKDNKYCVKDQNVEIIKSDITHTLRASSQCIIVGSRTAVIDNPYLTVRNGTFKQPLRVVVDSKGIVKSPNLMCKGTLICTTQSVSSDTLRFWDTHGVEYIVHEGPQVNIKRMLEQLALNYGVLQCLLEGGGDLHKVFDDSNLINELQIIRSGDNLPHGITWPVDENKYLSGKRIFAETTDAIETFKNNMVIVMDDTGRENEGDLIVHADIITEDMVTFIKNNTTGIICVTMNQQRALEMDLGLQVVNNTDPYGTAFTVTCDATSCSTGVCSRDRLLTIHALSHGSRSSIRKPGHIFPLIARKGGLSIRRGHTEASIDLCKLAGLKECAVICELTNTSGTMMKLQEIKELSEKFEIPIITTEQIYQECKKTGMYDFNYYPDVLLEAQCQIHTREQGMWELISYNSIYGNVKTFTYNLDSTQKCMVRIHSECFTGDILGSSHCDCGIQLQNSIKKIKEYGNGVILFPPNHEGRGIGFTNKIKAYSIMNKEGVDTYRANNILGFNDDLREYDLCVSVLKDLNVKSMILLTSNPDKIKAMKKEFEVEPQLLYCGLTDQNRNYLHSKSKKHGTFKLGLSETPQKDVRIAIVHSMWYSNIINSYIENISRELGIRDIYGVPGCFEIPLHIQQIIKDYDIIIAVGAIIKGETYHFEVISQTICNSLMDLQLKYNKPVVNVVLNCYTIDQVIERFSNNSIVDTVQFLKKNFKEKL
jgi:3,4-dihydroxy 2-butanone 4-phosphate synthase/GTP cyclohydrolase II